MSKTGIPLTVIIREAAERMAYATVHVVSNYGYVTISAPDQDDIFLQGDDASAFISEATHNWHMSGDVSMSECYAHLAEQYAQNLWD